MADEGMPGRWEDVPRAIKREVAQQLVARALEVHGWPALVRSLMAGRADLGMPLSQTYRATPAELYPFLAADAARRAAAEQEAKHAGG
jgi:hypothetical protein